jgi:hypothetical protein
MKKLNLITAILLINIISFGQIINVPSDYPTIQTGINAAINGDTVPVEQGTYFENINFLGKAITVASHYLIEKDSANIFNTIIDGSQPTNPDSASVVLFFSGEDSTSVIYGFTITGGTGTKFPDQVNFEEILAGGGIGIDNSGAKISHNIITDNTVDNEEEAFGAGIGGGLCTEGKWVVVEQNLITDNTAISNLWPKGGGMAIAYCNTRICNNTVTYNTVLANSDSMVAAAGGVWYSCDVGFPDSVIISGNIIQYNKVEQFSTNSDGTAGAGLCMYGAYGQTTRALVKNNVISDNELNAVSIAFGCGVALVNCHSVDFSQNEIYNNIVDADICFGGGLCIWNNHPIVSRNLIYGNMGATRGGGIYVGQLITSEPQFFNNTIYGNEATNSGCGLYLRNAECSVTNEIIWNNYGTPSPGISLYNSTVDVNYSDVEGWTGPGVGNIDADPLFADPANGDFHLTWDNFPIPDETKSPCIDTGDTLSPLDPDGTIADMGAFYFNQSQFTQQIILSPGFQFISSHLYPEIPDMEVVVAEILNDDLLYVRNSEGAMLRKIGPNWVNGIGDWIGIEGYLIKYNGTGQFIITGELIPPTTPIDVTAGFQFVSYLPTVEIDATEAFASIIGDDLIYVRNSEGAMLRKIGPNWVNGIGNCVPNEGYLVKMAVDAVLVYPEGGKSSGKITAVPTHFTFEGGNAADPVYTLYVSGLEIGDEIAAYDGDVMTGAMRINSKNTFENELAVFSTIFNGKGYQSGNSIILKIFDYSTQSIVETEYTLENVFGEAYMQNNYPSEDGLFSVINIVKGSGSLIEETLSVYPNPASDLLNINSNKQILKVKILNYTGQIVAENKFNSKEVIINTSVYNPGIYFIQIETEKGISTKKVVIE